MSAIYNLEPQPTASAILHTTLGEILVELFAKQTPLTCRNFLQHSLDGYYDGTIFHRLVPNFILQGGDPTGTGNGGECIYDGGAFSGDLDPWPMDERRGMNAGPTGIHFKDEFHSRLKFNRRGLLGMANESRENTNGSQFFFTLDKTEELNGKNTLFGRVAGDTIFNLAKIGESEVDADSGRPLYPVKIERVEILVNPFEDMKKRSRVAIHTTQKPASTTKPKKKRKGGKQLLSFGDDEGDEEVEEPALKKPKFDTRLVVQEDDQEEAEHSNKKPKTKKKQKAFLEAKKTEAISTAAETEKTPSRSAVDKSDSPQDKLHGRGGSSQTNTEEPEESPYRPDPPIPEKTALEKANEEIAALKASMRRTIHSEQPTKETKKKSALESMIPKTSMPARKRRIGANNASATDEQASLSLLRAFQSKLEKVPQKPAPPASTSKPDTEKGSEGTDAVEAAEATAEGEEEAALCDLHFIANCQSCTAWDDQQGQEDSDDEGWMSHSLSFAADKLGKDLRNRKKAEDELVVIDPREKAYSLKETKRAEREAKLGGTGRAWDQARDQARNAKLARASALAGRGAK
ncbi:Peptidyl-prolyl isomerase cwc27 [Claviceps sp. LM77 group G4]|nr:Peptidyl-prolyl isomerase cwc27 [Claviceps sp. LM77 group G4]KAG6082645.1 Peptidyl-prolyl isomerase cwc27 [Claviceps sp. LM84 group G4]KAG6084032.1 Peptidyl-prolyl isomerase cwc27 [Claviceps sp. LM78 group G4]